MAKFNTEQLKILQAHAEELYERLFTDDPDLMKTTCACCAARRELFRKLDPKLKERGVK